jgi:hypothetical protein
MVATHSSSPRPDEFKNGSKIFRTTPRSTEKNVPLKTDYEENQRQSIIIQQRLVK